MSSTEWFSPVRIPTPIAGVYPAVETRAVTEPETFRGQPTSGDGVRGRAFTAVGDSACTIQLPTSPSFRPCSICSTLFGATGPTGHLEGEPICDDCLLAMEPRLGMVLALVAIVRNYGSAEPAGAGELGMMRAELLAFARIYHRWASKFGPGRPPMGTIHDLAGHAVVDGDPEYGPAVDSGEPPVGEVDLAAEPQEVDSPESDPDARETHEGPGAA